MLRNPSLQEGCTWHDAEFQKAAHHGHPKFADKIMAICRDAFLCHAGFPEGIAFPTSGYKCGSPTLAGGYLNPVVLGMNRFAVDIEKQMTLSGVCLHVVGLHPRGKSQ